MPTPYFPSRWFISQPDVSDDPNVFPFLVGQSFLQQKMPVWSTKTNTSVSGVERRRALWSYPIWKFKVGYEVIKDMPTMPELQKLYAFFNMHYGSFSTWFYFDRSDNSGIGQPLGLGDGITAVFKLKKTKQFGSISFSEPIGGINGPPTIYSDGNVTTNFTVDSYGNVTFLSPPVAGSVLTWDGSYFFLCRFTEDSMDISQMMTGLWNSSGIKFQTVKS